ncbi:MAG TPA: type II toxin-antitoxin system HicB family antitoxin [Vicinamibacteria bacterium]|nr:type II toxin-antitoxin system HicB family antitoxin [Vicinamibacteria bacterium]
MPIESTPRKLTYNVFVKKTGNRFTATVVGFPNCTVKAASRAEAIERARDAVAEFVSEAELVKIEVETVSQTPSLRDFAGMWADDETFDEFVEAMQSYRQETDASEPAS